MSIAMEKIPNSTALHVEQLHNDTAAHHDDKSYQPHGEVADEAIGGSVEDMPPGYYTSFSFIGTVLGASSSYYACYLGFSLPANVLTIINDDLGPDSNYTWIAIVWSLMSAVAFLLLGRLSDLFGRRWFFVGGAAVGLLGAIIASVAHNINTLIGATALLGIATGSQISYATVLSELLPNKYRGIGIGLIALSTTPVSMFGSVIMRLWILHTAASWRWSYYCCIIANAISLICFALCYHPPTFSLLHAKGHQVSKWRMIDIVGVFSFTLGLLLLLLGLSWGGENYPWKSGMVIGFMVAGALILVFFVLWEIYGAGDYPLVPMRFFRNRGFVAMLVTAGVAFMVFVALSILFPIQLELMYARSVLDIGWKSTIVGIGSILGDCLAGLSLKVFGKHKYQLVLYCAVLTAFTGGLAASTPSSEGLALAFVLLASFAVGALGNANLSLTPFVLEEQDIGIALGLIGTARSTFSAIGQAIFVAVLDNGLTTNIPKYVVPAAVDAGLPDSSAVALLEGLAVGNLTAVPGITTAIAAAAATADKLAYSQSFKLVYYAAIPFGICACIAAMLFPDQEHRFTNEVARKLHGSGIKEDHAHNV